MHPERTALQVADMDARLEFGSCASRGRSGWTPRHGRQLALAAMLAVAVLALFVIGRFLNSVRLADVERAVAATQLWRVGVALGLTAASYALLTLYDWFALRTIGRPLPWRTASFASFTSYALSHNLGFAWLTGGSARWRAYSAAGLDLADVARVTVLASANFWGGTVLLAGLSLLLPGPHHLHMGHVLRSLTGAILVAIVLLPFVLRFAGIRAIGWGRVAVPLPSMAVMGAQLLVSTLDLLCASTALFILIPGAASLGFGGFFFAYAAAIILGLITHVPGGLFVFEAAILALVPYQPHALLASLLLYRLIYYILPLLAALGLLLAPARERMAAYAGAARAAVGAIGWSTAPAVCALGVFGAGLVLLLSGALPPIGVRMHMLRDLIPLPLVELAHFTASLAGIALVLLAPAVQARLRSGFLLARALLLAGTLLSLLKGFDFEEAGIMLFCAAVLQIARPSFYRRAGLAGAPIGDWWWAAALGALVLSIWVGFVAFRHVPYSNHLWTMFDWHGAAARFLRAAAGASLFALFVSIWRVTSAPAPEQSDNRLPIGVAHEALASSQRADAMLAFTGDKSFQVSGAGDAFLMYRRQGRSWIVMGDPVGPLPRWPELAWKMRQVCDRMHGRLCVYQASAAMLPLLVELGLRPIKYGEEALIDLSNGFSLEGSARKSLRYSVKRAEAAGLSFEIIPSCAVPAHIEELRHVSDKWLAHKKTGERCFSLGQFDPDYLRRFDCAVLRIDGRIVAFANIWQSGDGRELSVDLMRHLPNAPYGAMDYLFVSLMQWGAAEGFACFNLGLAPLSGLIDAREAPFWSRAAATIFRHGEWIYGFSGLRAFKEKFGPSWVPRYIAVPDGLSGWRALIDLAALVAG
jgi:phosphatidylglycerol lysyltransferase